MLVISRKVGQVFTVGENVVVYFLGYGNGRASIGVEAPREVPILRDDIKVAMAAGVPLHAIEDALDSRENQEPTPEATEECRCLRATIEVHLETIRGLIEEHDRLEIMVREREWIIESYREKFDAMVEKIDELTPECGQCDDCVAVCPACSGSGGLLSACCTCGGSGTVKCSGCGEDGEA